MKTKEVKLVYSELVWELCTCYMEATYSDRDYNYPAYSILSKAINEVLNGGSKTMWFTKIEANTFLETLKNVAHSCTFDCMHPSTKRGYQTMLRKIKEQLN